MYSMAVLFICFAVELFVRKKLDMIIYMYSMAVLFICFAAELFVRIKLEYSFISRQTRRGVGVSLELFAIALLKV